MQRLLFPLNDLLGKRTKCAVLLLPAKRSAGASAPRTAQAQPMGTPCCLAGHFRAGVREDGLADECCEVAEARETLFNTTKLRKRSRPLNVSKRARVAAKNKTQKRNRTLGLTPEIRGQ